MGMSPDEKMSDYYNKQHAANTVGPVGNGVLLEREAEEAVAPTPEAVNEPVVESTAETPEADAPVEASEKDEPDTDAPDETPESAKAGE